MFQERTACANESQRKNTGVCTSGAYTMSREEEKSNQEWTKKNMENYIDKIKKFTLFWEQWETQVFKAQFWYDLNCLDRLLGIIWKVNYFLFILSGFKK